MSAAVTLRVAPGGKVQFQGRAEDLPPDQLVRLRAYRDELAPIIAAYGEVEVFNRRGRHLGVVHAINGIFIKDPVKGRRISV